jgi:hypothetical protein
MTPLAVFALVLLGIGTLIGSNLGSALAGFLVAFGLLAAFIWKAGK